MGFEGFERNGTGRRGGRGGMPPNCVRLCKQNMGRQKATLVATIGESLMEELRWVAGDRIYPKIDRDNGLILFVRVPDASKKGFTLSAQGKGEKKRGKCWRSCMKMTPEDWAFSVIFPEEENYFTDQVQVTPEGLLVELPNGRGGD